VKRYRGANCIRRREFFPIPRVRLISKMNRIPKKRIKWETGEQLLAFFIFRLERQNHFVIG
jgi:hypothetical protein